MTQWYVFHPLSEEQKLDVQKTLKEMGKAHNMNGLILLAQEGCNGTVAGSREALEVIKKYLTEQFGEVFFQDWESDIKPFRRFKVDLRSEIVALKKPAIQPEGKRDHLSPKDFHQMLAHEDVTVLDTRNWYETKIGSFKGAVIPNIKSFQEFPRFVEGGSVSKDKPVLMYCTSGIRCEKAAEEMRSQGYKKVYQLDGGITNYLKEYPDGHWNGECFVFDHRCAVNSKLERSERYTLCASCGNPADIHTTCQNCKKACTLCADCLAASPASCSKACKHVLEQVLVQLKG